MSTAPGTYDYIHNFYWDYAELVQLILGEVWYEQNAVIPTDRVADE